MPTIELFFVDGSLAILLCIASLFVGMSKGGLPGIGMISVPLLALVMSPVAAAVLLLPIYILSDVVGVWLYRRDFSLRNLKVLIPAGVLGVMLGWSTASVISEQRVSLLIGVLGVGFCLSRWFGGSVPAKARQPGLIRGLCWGTLSGFTSFVSHAGSPPYQIYVLPQKLPKLVFAGTTTLLFAIVNLAKVIPYASLHPYSAETLRLSLILVPIAAAGTYLGRFFVNHLSERWFYFVVQVALFAICSKLVVSSVWVVF